MNILVTGAAGFLGSHLCDYLLKNNHKVIGVDNYFRGKAENLPVHSNFKFYKFDLTQNFKFIIENENPEIIFHYAAINGTKYFYDIPYKVLNDNILINQNLLIACQDSNVKKIIYTSSSEVYGPTPVIPTSENEPIILHSLSNRDSYASSKAFGEFQIRIWCEQNGIDWLILRPFNTYGPRMVSGGYGQVIPELIQRMKEDEFYIYGNGNQTRSFCYVEDHIKIAYILMHKSKNQIVNIGFDEEITILDLAKKIKKIYNNKNKIGFKDAWENDTKWRKPSLLKLLSYVKNFTFTSLDEGLLNMKKLF